MSRHNVSYIWAGLAVLSVWAGAQLFAEDGWRAGMARAKITPEEPMWMAGYSSRTNVAQGELHDLWIKALALDDGAGHRAVVVTSDLLGFPRNMTDPICNKVQTLHGLGRGEIMLSASHTHSGPVLRGALYDIYPLDDAQRDRIEKYSSGLEKTVVETVGAAISALRPVKLGFIQATCGFAANRRENTEQAVSALRASGRPTKGPSDHDVPILAVRDTADRLMAVVFGYACHNTTLAGYEWCGDYAGFAQIELETRHPGAQAMFVSGCGADQNPIPRRTVELCQEYGRQLAEAVDGAVKKGATPIAPKLNTAFECITLDFDGPLDEQALKTAAAKGGYEGRWANRLLGEISAGKKLETSYSYPVQVWRLGDDRVWIALGGEVVVDYALKFKSAYGGDTWVTGYANDVMAYIPSRRVRDEGRYEAGAFGVYGLPARAWCQDIEERITDAVERLIGRTAAR